MSTAGRQILFYGDSNTYGYDPADLYENRYPENVRWIDTVSKELRGEWTVLCDAMNGRRIPDLRYDTERTDRMVSRLNTHDMLAVMLGTNDILLTVNPDAAAAIRRMDSFLSYLCSRRSPEDILVIAPPNIASGNTTHPLYGKYFEESRKMNEGFCQLAKTYATGFLDAGTWNIPLSFDMVHFSEEGHRIFAKKLVEYLRESFQS